MPKRLNRLKVAAVAGALVAATALAATYVVPTGVSIPVYEKRGSMNPLIGTLTAGQSPDIISDDGEWLIIQLNGKYGTVKKTAFDPPKGSMFGSGPLGPAVGPQAKGAEASAAARGLDGDTVFYAKNTNLSTDGLQEMLNAATAAAGVEFIKFTREGNVGPI